MEKTPGPLISAVALCALLALAGCDSSGGDAGDRDMDMSDVGTADASNAAAPGAQGCHSSPCFQSAFHQALREDIEFGETTTLRLFLPLGKAGDRLKVTLRSGPRELFVERAFVARLGRDGKSAIDAAPLTFGGQAATRLQPRSSQTSDAVPFAVAFREIVALSLVVRGSAAASAIPLFPDNQSIPGDRAEEGLIIGAQPLDRAVAVSNLSVEGTSDRAFIALGDSITEGYVEGDDRYLESWPAVAESLLKLPVVNAGVSGQGLDGVLSYLSAEVLSAEGITDCLILIGTNDLGGTPVGQIEENYDRLIDRLSPFCRVHLCVLPPKEMAEIQADRTALNDWIRANQKANSVIDFESVLAAPGDPTRFAPGLGMDGIHPTVEGQFRMGRLAAERLK